MTDTEQTFLKQRLEEVQVDRNYENQSGVRSEFFDIHGNNLNSVETLESYLEFTGTNAPEEEQRTEVTVTEQLHKRIRELEAIILQQNKEIRNNEALQRNYNAALRKLQRKEMEASFLQEDREEYYNESQFYQLQAQEKSKQCEKHEDRIRHMNVSLIDKERTIRELERQVMLLKQHSRHAAEERLPLLRKQEVNTSLPETGTDQSGSQTKKRRRDFRRSLTNLPHCIHCQTVFDLLEPHQVACTFHRTYPQPLKVWKSQFGIHGNKPQSSVLGSYRFWPCCEKYGIKEPPGCLTLKSHELVYPDEE